MMLNAECKLGQAIVRGVCGLGLRLSPKHGLGLGV